MPFRFAAVTGVLLATWTIASTAQNPQMTAMALAHLAEERVIGKQ